MDSVADGGQYLQQRLLPALSWLLIGSTLIFVIKLVGTLIYNVYFHPLSKFPGPKLAAATPIPFVRRLLNGRWVEWTTALHTTYGEVVRIHPDELSFVGASAWRDIFLSRPQLPKPKVGVIRSSNGVPNIATTDDIEDHTRLRRIIGNALSDKALKEQEYILKTYTDLLIQKLQEQVTVSIDAKSFTTDIQKWYIATTFDTLGDLQFGESFHSLESHDDHPWILSIFRGIKFGMLLTIFHHFPPLQAKWFLPRIVQDKADAHFQWACKQIERRLNRETERPDFMKYILNTSEEKGMSRDEIDSNSTLLILAGSETSATTCASATWFLVKNPVTLKKLRDEVRSSFQSMEEITVTSASKLPYLHAVIQEALRLHPTEPISVTRLVDRPGVTVSGYQIPVGTSVGIPQKSACQLPSNFVEPLAFLPERWLKNTAPKFDADVKAVSEPFLVGPRNCLGKSLAWAEMNLILAKVVWNFDLELSEKTKEDWSDQKIWLMHEGAPLYVKISPRAA